MLNNIKSKYILKILFSYIDEERKLKVIKYNKSLQNLNRISLIIVKIILDDSLFK